MAITPGVERSTPEPMNRHVNVFSHDAVNVASFYRQRVDQDPASDDSTRQGLWGIRAESALPLLDARAKVDYSEYLPAGSRQTFTGSDQAEDANRLVRLNLQDSNRYLDYRMSVFSVGRAYVNEPLGRERLNAMNLPGAGQGAELQASGRIPFLDLEPSFRRVDVSEQIAGKDETRTSSLVSMGLRSEIPMGAVFLRRSQSEFQLGQQSQSRWRWEAGGTLAPFGKNLSLSPFLAQERSRGESAAELRANQFGLNLKTTFPGTATMRLNLMHKVSETLNQGEQEHVSADLALITPLSLWERAPRGITLSTSIGYRGLHGTASPSPQEGVSVRFNFNFYQQASR